jgi:hypothetical protein
LLIGVRVLGSENIGSDYLPFVIGGWLSGDEDRGDTLRRRPISEDNAAFVFYRNLESSGCVI